MDSCLRRVENRNAGAVRCERPPKIGVGDCVEASQLSSSSLDDVDRCENELTAGAPFCDRAHARREDGASHAAVDQRAGRDLLRGAARDRNTHQTWTASRFAPVDDRGTRPGSGARRADPDGAIAAYSLSFGDAHSTDLVTSLTASHAYPTGTFTANVYVLDNGGAVAVRTATVTVTNMLPVATFTYRVQRRNGLTVLKTPVRAPQANAFCERLK